MYFIYIVFQSLDEAESGQPQGGHSLSHQHPGHSSSHKQRGHSSTHQHRGHPSSHRRSGYQSGGQTSSHNSGYGSGGQTSSHNSEYGSNEQAIHPNVPQITTRQRGHPSSHHSPSLHSQSPIQSTQTLHDPDFLNCLKLSDLMFADPKGTIAEKPNVAFRTPTTFNKKTQSRISKEAAEDDLKQNLMFSGPIICEMFNKCRLYIYIY